MEIYLAVSRSDGSVAHVAFQTEGRFPSRPLGGWEKAPDKFVWTREASDGNIEFELARVNANWSRMGDPVMVGWRRLSDEEHRVFETDRVYRDALTDVDGKLQHDMPKARALHKAYLRHQNGDRFMTLDREWVDKSARGDAAGAAAIEARRQALRDFVDDPRIEEAATVEELKRVVPDERALPEAAAR